MYRVFCFCVTCYVFLLLNIGAVIEPPKEDSTSKKAQVLPPCQACKTLVNSFIKVMKLVVCGVGSVIHFFIFVGYGENF